MGKFDGNWNSSPSNPMRSSKPLELSGWIFTAQNHHPCFCSRFNIKKSFQVMGKTGGHTTFKMCDHRRGMMESTLRSLTRASHGGGIETKMAGFFLESYPPPRTYKREGMRAISYHEVSMIELKKGTVFRSFCSSESLKSQTSPPPQLWQCRQGSEGCLRKPMWTPCHVLRFCDKTCRRDGSPGVRIGWICSSRFGILGHLCIAWSMKISVGCVSCCISFAFYWHLIDILMNRILSF